jgi:shikimate 5-dehydrogenase
MRVDRDTMVCVSFAKEAGKFGAAVHNLAAAYHHLNFIYKPFSVDDIEAAVKAMRLLKFRGAGVTMPFKIEVLKYVDELSPEVREIGSANTILNEDGRLIAHNTDWLAARKMIFEKMRPGLQVWVLGRGGYAKAVAYAARQLGYEPQFVSRSDATWQVLNAVEGKLIYNCTPARDLLLKNSNVFVDGNVGTETGRCLALWQAKEQFELYTGKMFPMEWVKAELVGIAI